VGTGTSVPARPDSFFTLLLAFSIVFLFAQFAWFAAIDFFNSPTVRRSFASRTDSGLPYCLDFSRAELVDLGWVCRIQDGLELSETCLRSQGDLGQAPVGGGNVVRSGPLADPHAKAYFLLGQAVEAVQGQAQGLFGRQARGGKFLSLLGGCEILHD
jgi:hypothetical protein